jgi:dephospho-CoA kinase
LVGLYATNADLDGELPFVGLTGGIGAGKSTALAALERLGAAVLSTDAVVHELYDSPQLRELLVSRWGRKVAPDGVVDRAAVARSAFADDGERRWLESVIWPRVGERMMEWRAEQQARTPRPAAAVVEVPLLFEASMDGVFDATIAIVADEQLRERRAAGRGHAAVAERTAAQLPQDEKARRATYVVRNDGDEAELQSALADVLAAIGSEA